MIAPTFLRLKETAETKVSPAEWLSRYACLSSVLTRASFAGGSPMTGRIIRNVSDPGQKSGTRHQDNRMNVLSLE
jgi:hypothetical protein